jgi:hypothetical protein
VLAALSASCCRRTAPAEKGGGAANEAAATPAAAIPLLSVPDVTPPLGGVRGMAMAAAVCIGPHASSPSALQPQLATDLPRPFNPLDAGRGIGNQ